MKRGGKATMPFKCDLNQIPYDYTLEVTYRLKELDLTEFQKTYGGRFIALYTRQ